MSILVNWLESLHEEMKVTTKCSRERNRKSTCNDCVENCEHNAIELKDDLFIIDTKKCTMCGECMIACPLSAIEGLASNRLFEKGSLVFDESYVPSLKELLIYKKRGMTTIQVAHQPFNQEWETVLRVTNEQLQLLEETPIVVVERVKDEVLSRRALFGSFQKERKQLAKKMAPAAWKMEKDDWQLTKYYPDYQFFSVKLDKDKCTLCNACFTLCPEEVFHLKESMLQIKNEKCVGCSSCTEVCQENAIEIVPDIKRKREQVVYVHSKNCKDCGHSFYTFGIREMSCLYKQRSRLVKSVLGLFE
ncbi:Fe-S-cluster-containing hydrogenase component 2 [Neobacillus niacini]|uniref:4Fe-4S dicluster domain-containing protein n=1 Tax=Neobacillus niacini TaxID=86668 RepID=UPI00285AD54A|nr:4Fe-4S dicluster domain-containing protein [Neobacillus niacini]MDR7075460.1 Fe-S-cluster-containing hydrogenase component 2 [Neobacillus niacini]